MSGEPVCGSCLCGDVRFEVERPLRDVIVCHCTFCRRSGTNAAAYTWAPHRAVRLLEPNELRVYVDRNGRERSFCGTCGASLFWVVPGGEGVSISAGALDGDPGLRVARHIHADSAAPWESLPHGVPVHREDSSSPVVAGGDE